MLKCIVKWLSKKTLNIDIDDLTSKSVVTKMQLDELRAASKRVFARYGTDKSVEWDDLHRLLNQ